MRKRVTQTIRIIIILLALVPLMDASAGRGKAKPSADTSLTDVEYSYIVFMREEEKLARDVYVNLGKLWGMMIFDNISISEQQHMDAVETLVEGYGLQDPVEDESDVGSFDNAELDSLYPTLVTRGSQSQMAALMVGALIEEVDMEDIQLAIDSTNKGDIKAVYESLLCGSRNHLRAFVSQIESGGQIYESQLYPEDMEWKAFIESVIDSQVERNCVGSRR